MIKTITVIQSNLFFFNWRNLQALISQGLTVCVCVGMWDEMKVWEQLQDTYELSGWTCPSVEVHRDMNTGQKRWGYDRRIGCGCAASPLNKHNVPAYALGLKHTRVITFKRKRTYSLLLLTTELVFGIRLPRFTARPADGREEAITRKGGGLFLLGIFKLCKMYYRINWFYVIFLRSQRAAVCNESNSLLRASKTDKMLFFGSHTIFS